MTMGDPWGIKSFRVGGKPHGSKCIITLLVITSCHKMKLMNFLMEVTHQYHILVLLFQSTELINMTLSLIHSNTLLQDNWRKLITN